ncbi:MAG: DNA primase [Actinomycetaceae bacterium]|nr:DNA primase [Actinomycetaceae bacterium]
MSNDPRAALDQLIAAFEAHFALASQEGPDSPELGNAEDALQDAFFTYDNVLFSVYDAELPFDIMMDEDSDDDEYYEDDDHDEDEDDDHDEDDYFDYDSYDERVAPEDLEDTVER